MLDLACGDGALLAHLPGGIGIDLTHAELRRAHGPVACARAEALPFAARAFEAVACHLAFMLFPDPEVIVRELARVLVPGGTFLALLGGGPTAEGDDAFHRFLALLPPRQIPTLGDPRARSEVGWRSMFAGWDVSPFERWTLDLGGTFDEVWSFLGASYEASPALEAPLRAATAAWGTRIPCTAVAYVARAVHRP